MEIIMEIKVKDLAITISGKKIFSNISFEMKKGEMVAITGVSGCGKTTLLNCLGLIQPVDCGNIVIDGKNITNLEDRDKTKFWNKYTSFIYQDYGIIEDESVAYNVTLDKSKMRTNKVQTVLEKVGLQGRDNDLAIVLSGGEKQRLGIARAIFKNATIIYADEPTASLDMNNRELVIELLRQCAKDGTIVVLATHDERLVNECDRIISMKTFCK